MEVALLLFLLAIAASMLVPFLSLAPWLPTRGRDIDRALTLAGLKPGERFYDLGCGDGRVVSAAAGRGAEAIGLEISFAMWLFCRVRQAFGFADGATFRFKNLFGQDLSDADVVYVYGLPEVNAKRLKPKLEAELKPGARVVAYEFRFDGWQPTAIDGSPPRDKRIYLYTR
jgi:SAM-dependent methyltransferase